MHPSFPPVSVITIFLNAEIFIKEAIRSVLAQSYTDLELILVDDGSVDSSSAIARAYAARHPDRVRYVEHEGHANRGMSASRNVGLRCARGEFVAFIDADDVWAPNKLAEQVAIMKAHPRLGMVCGAVRYWGSWAGSQDVIVPTGHAQNQVVTPPEACLRLYPLGTAAAPCPSDMLLRRSTLDGVGGFEDHFTGPRQMYEDQAFLAKLYLMAPVYFADRVWLDYRQHSESCMATVTREGKYHDVRRYFLEWLERYLQSSGSNTDPEVYAALGRALRPYRRPLVHAAATLTGPLRRIPGRIGAAAAAPFGKAGSA